MARHRPLRRALYPKHLAFFAAGAAHRERLFMAVNRVGKTEGVGGYETVLHLTGGYPQWWEGRRFDRPVSARVPGEAIGGCAWRGAFPDLANTVSIRHASGGFSTLGLKSYQQGRGAFEGTEQDVVWLDEEPPLDVYVECLVRTMTTGGLVMVTVEIMQSIAARLWG